VTDERASYRLGLLMVLTGTVAWSFAGYFTRLIALDSWTMLFWRGVFGALTAAAMLVAQRRGRIVPAFRALGGAGLLFTFVSALGMTAFLSALRLTTVAHVAIIYATIPFVAAAMAWVVLRERTTPATLLACVVAFLGVTLTVAAGVGEGSLAGDLLALGMTLLMGVSFVIARRSRGIPMVPSACLAALIAAAAALPFAHPWPIPAGQLLALALFGISNMGFGLILVTAGSKLLPAVESALIGSLEAPLAPFWVWLAFGETPRPSTVLGGALVMAAVLAHVLLAARRTRMVPASNA
jgi:drug/metabolite transporter (DMT)-like permease